MDIGRYPSDLCYMEQEIYFKPGEQGGGVEGRRYWGIRREVEAPGNGMVTRVLVRG